VLGARLQSRTHRLGAQQLEQLERLDQALDHARPERPGADVPFDESRRRLGHERGSRRRELLHAARDVCRLSDRRVVHAEVVADGPDDDFAGVQTNPDVDGRAHGRPLLGVAPHRLLKAKRRVAAAQRVVFLRQRGAEERHDPVAHHLVDGAFVPVDGVHHELEDRVEQLPGLFRVSLHQQLHRPLEISEEDRYLLALALEGRLRREDLVREVARGVGARRAEADPRRGHDRKVGTGRASALAAELGGRRQERAARSAAKRERRATGVAESRLAGIVGAAAQAAHGRFSLYHNGVNF
jgi:hypothetical protein